MIPILDEDKETRDFPVNKITVTKCAHQKTFIEKNSPDSFAKENDEKKASIGKWCG